MLPQMKQLVKTMYGGDFMSKSPEVAIQFLEDGNIQCRKIPRTRNFPIQINLQAEDRCIVL